MSKLNAIRRRKKIGISITVDEDNLKYVKEEVNKQTKSRGVNLSSLFDMLLDEFVEDLKKGEKLEIIPEEET